MALSIDIAANTRAAQRDVKDLSRALDDTSDALDDLARDSTRSADKVEASFRDMQRAAEKADDAVSDIGRGGSANLTRVRDGAKEVTQEVGQNLGEAVSSIRGDLSDLGQVGQDTLGGLAATLAGAGPGGIIGAATLAGGAVGLGLVTAELQRQQEEADKLRERLSGMYQKAAEEGRSYLDTAQFIAEATDVMFNPDRADEWKRLQEDAKELGLSQQTLIQANAGDLDSLAEVQKRVNGLVDEERQKREDMGAFFGGQNKNLEEQRLEGIRDRWQQIADASQELADKAGVASNVTSDMWRDAIEGAKNATREVDEFGNVLYTLDGDKQVVIEADTGQATTNVSKFKGDADGVIDQLNGKEIILRADADVSAVTRAVDRVIAQNGGKTIKIGTRIVTAEGGWQ